MKNIRISFVFYIINMFFMFISRSIFIKFLGADIAGVNSLFTSLIGFLNVAELGVGIAVGYSLYKPLSDNNYKKINDIMILFKVYYRNVAKIILILGSLISIFLPFLIKEQINTRASYLYYFIYLINCVLSYLFTYKQTLIISDQKQYKIAFIANITKIIKIVMQCFILMIIQKFILWLIIESIFNLVGMILVNIKIDKEYKNKVTYHSEKTLNQIKEENRNIGENIKNVFFHKIGGFVVFQTDAILISFFSTLKETAIYANYIMIINSLNGLLGTVVGSIMPTIGNLIVEETEEKAYEVFRKLLLFDHLIAMFITFLTYKLVNTFIEFWVGSEYLFSNQIVIVLMVNLYITISRGTVDRFKNGFGIYWDVLSPVCESCINLFCSLVLAYKFGIIGIFIGTLISNIIIIELWQPYIVFKQGFNKSIKLYISQLGNILIRNVVIIFVSDYFYNLIVVHVEINNMLLELIINGLILSIVFTISSCLIYITDKEFRGILKKITFKYIIK